MSEEMTSACLPGVSRRSFLRTSLMATLASTAASSVSAAQQQGFIDAHVHVWTPDTDRYPLAEGFEKKDMQPPSFTPEELLREARPHGVEKIVLIQMSFYKYDNSYMLDTMERFPGVFGGVAIIDETQPQVRQRMQELKRKGVRGFRLYTDRERAEKWESSPGMKEMWKVGADEGLAMCLLANPDALPAVSRMRRQFPKTPVVIDHFARIGISGRIEEEALDELCKLGEHPDTYVKTSAFYALGKKQAPYEDLGPMIQRLRDAYGSQRLMWATDCPFQVQKGHTYGASVELVRDRLSFLTPTDREWILRKTAEHVFFS